MMIRKMMSKLVCASVLLVPLVVPVAAHGQGLSDPTVTFTLTVNGAPCADTTYWGYTAIVQSGGMSYVQLTDPDQDGVYTGSAAPLYAGAKAVVSLVQGTGVAHATPMPGGTPIPVPGAPNRVLTDFGTQEQDGLRYLTLNDDFSADAAVQGCTAAPSATPMPSATPEPSATQTPSATPTPSASAVPTDDTTVSFKLAVNGTACEGATYWGYTAILSSDGISYTQLTDPDGDGVYTGMAGALYAGAKVAVHLVQGTGVKQVSFPTAGGPLVNVPGAPSRVIAAFGTEHQDGFTFLTLNNDFLAEASANGCAAAPSATPAATANPSATPAPSATAKPSVSASATPKSSASAAATPKPSAPSTLPDTGAGETMLSGLLAAGAALAASGAYLLRRRAR